MVWVFPSQFEECENLGRLRHRRRQRFSDGLLPHGKGKGKIVDSPLPALSIFSSTDYQIKTFPSFSAPQFDQQGRKGASEESRMTAAAIVVFVSALEVRLFGLPVNHDHGDIRI